MNYPTRLVEMPFDQVTASHKFKTMKESRFVLQRCCDTSQMVKAIVAPKRSEHLLGVPRPGPSPTAIVYVIR